MTMVNTAGMNPGECRDGNDNMVGGCANTVVVSSADPFVGMWDIESIENMYTGDNRFRYDYSLYCSW